MLKEIFDWSEAWAPLVPLITLLFVKQQPTYFRPVIFYLCIALLLNIAVDIIWKQKILGVHLFTNNNNPLYNLNSITRLLAFSIFFIKLQQPFLATIKKILPLVFMIFLIINFTFLENFLQRKISSNLHALEATFLLFYCLQYFLYLLKEEQISPVKSAHIWVVIGLSVFVAASIPIYLFYDSAIKTDLPFTVTIWQVQKIVFLILCILISKAFYDSNR